MRDWQTTAIGIAILAIAAVLIIHAPHILDRAEGQAIIGLMILAGGGFVKAADSKK